MKKAKALLFAFGAVGLAASLVACSGASSSTGSEPASASAPATTALKIGLVMLQGDTYFQGIQSGAEEAAKADGNEVVTGLSNNDPATENQVVQNMIQAKVDAILIQPTGDEASAATVKAIKDAGIPVICYGNCTPPLTDTAGFDGIIQSDNTALGTGTGEAAAKYAKDKLGGTINLAILNCDIASACKLRKSGFLEAMTAAGVTVNTVTDQEAYLTDKAQPVATDIMTAHPDVTMFWASNEGGTTGAALAVQASGKKIPVFGTDISKQLAQFVIAPDDVLQATTGQDPVGTAQGAYEMAKKAIAGEKNDPLSVELPGITYDRTNPETTNAFLETAQ